MIGSLHLPRALAALALSLLPSLAAAQWPTQPVRIMVPFAPGALTDLAARNIAAELSAQIGQQFVVENKGGAAGTIGTAEVAKARPDGHTLVFTDSSLTISPGLYKSLPYDVLRGTMEKIHRKMSGFICYPFLKYFSKNFYGCQESVMKFLQTNKFYNK